jgi:zinc transporter ZupT
MDSPYELAMASLLGLGTTSSSLLGAAIGLYVPFSKRPLACLLAFAAGSLISALAIELAYESAQSLHHQGYDAHSAWAFVSAGFAAGAIIYYSASLFLEKRERPSATSPSFANMPWRASRRMRASESSCWRHAT